MKRTLSALLLLLLLAAGCMTEEKGILSPEIPFEKGRTTFREAIATWGNPDSIKGDTAVWKVTTANGGRIKASYMMVGITASSQRRATREYRLTFDARYVLKDIQVVDSIPDGARWGILPW